jgi:outer membrane lipoprotein-sorting protein
MIRKTMAGLFVACLMSSAAWAQTADELIEKNIQARGGREKLAAIKTLRMTGKMTMGPGMEAPFVQELSRPNKVRVEFTFQGMTGIQTYDGKEGWALMPFMGKTEPEAVPADQLKTMDEQADLDGLLVDYKDKGHQVEYAGKEDLEGTPAHKLKITKKDGDVAYLWLDAEHFLEMKIAGKTKVRDQEVEGETVFGDYKEVGGVIFPHSIENRAVGMPGGMTITVDKVEVNPELTDDRFAKPQAAKGAAPKPQ